MEIEYHQDMFYHQLPLGFIVKIQDILIFLGMMSVFVAVILFDSIRYAFRGIRPVRRSIEVQPIQEIRKLF